jgi:flagellar biosynthesis protein FlhG
MTTDQATRLRELAADMKDQSGKREHVTSPASSSISSMEQPLGAEVSSLAHATAFVSGKGGVGKSNLALNLSIALACRGKKVVLFDADMGMANLDVLCGLTPQATLEDVVKGQARLRDVLVTGPGGFQLVPGASGVAAMANLDGLSRRRIISQLSLLDDVADHLLIDMGAGISSSVIPFAAVADRVVVVTTPEPTAMTDAYGVIKTLVSRGFGSRLELVVNMAHTHEEGLGVYRRIERVVGQFLGAKLRLAAILPHDPLLSSAVRIRKPVLLASPHAPITRAIDGLARSMLGIQSLSGEAVLADRSQTPDSAGTSEQSGFFKRLARMLKSKA